MASRGVINHAGRDARGFKNLGSCKLEHLLRVALRAHAKNMRSVKIYHELPERMSEQAKLDFRIASLLRSSSFQIYVGKVTIGCHGCSPEG